MDSFIFEDDVLTLFFKGEIDHHTVASIRENADELINKHRPIKTVLDFSGVTFCDSSGIALVMGRYKQMICCGGILELAGLPPRIAIIFSMAGMDRMIKITEQERKK